MLNIVCFEKRVGLHCFHKLKLNTLVIVMASLILAACGQHQVKSNKDYSVASDEKNGLVVFSFTKSGVRDVPFTILYRGVDSQNKRVAGRIPIHGKNDWTAPRRTYNTTAKSSVEGRVVTLKLPAGRYEFFDLYIEFGYRQSEWVSGQEFSIPFVSTASTTEYLGNVHVWSQDRTDDGLSYQFYQGDERVRDITVFRKNFPNVQKVNYSILSSNESSVELSQDDDNIPEEYLEILSLEPTDAEAHKNRAALYIKLGLYQKALIHTNKAISLDGKLADAYTYRSLLYLSDGQLSKSLSDANAAIRYDPNNALGLLARSIALFANNDKEKAKRDYKRAIAIDPSIADTFSNIPEISSIIEDL